ncbi:hypothetical protein LCGC14_1279850 [marine sediment metagenome]|uniref:RanBP2-type domain-containing protein n=1 Tax=marine sediment metagenome TaxID=412755 RepID=A0A0F9LGV9_9ZZZZ
MSKYKKKTDWLCNHCLTINDVYARTCSSCMKIEMAKLDNLEWLAYLVQRRDEAEAEFLEELRETDRIADNMRDVWKNQNAQSEVV